MIRKAIFNWRKWRMNIGDIVLYVDEFDADESEHPNIGASVVTKIHANGNADLAVFAENGLFFKSNVPQGTPDQRGTWHQR